MLPRTSIVKQVIVVLPPLSYIFKDDDEDYDLFEAAGESDFFPDVDGVQGEGNDHHSSSSLYEKEAPLGPPVGDDPAALELSKTVSVRLPNEGQTGAEK